ncbi:MAG: hypothetical protein Unbinned1819contig1001_12 [Prokaryotic dsDNA virus sp.]|nr:MAG: hypothetical protein Unbinned1819contig1001_12 [Prokaryotic dsDNA virus sp.]|tara:strand:+ start:402 stop:827 length:426 start_codon:yes stop_codon:yes gene_type:complete
MAAADLNAIRATVEGRLATELASSPVIPVVFHNMAYEPTPSSSWVQCLTTFGDSEFLSHGSTTNSQNRIIGLLVINIFSAKGVGPGANLTIGKRVRDLYNRVIASGVFFDAPTGPQALATPSPEGYFQSQVRVTFEFIEDL